MIFEAKLNLPSGSFSPDSLDESAGLIPGENFVVSRDRHGQPKSRFRDVVWDYSAYSPEGKVTKLYFNFWGKGNPTDAQLGLASELKSVIFCLIWRRAGSPLSMGTLQNYLSVLTSLADHSFKHEMSVSALLNNESKLSEFALRHCSGWMAETLCSLLPQLGQIGAAKLGFLVVGDRCINRLKKENRVYRSGIKQHAPMTTRIYSLFIAGLQKELSEWMIVSENILQAARYCAADSRAGRSHHWQRQLSKQWGLPPEPLQELEEILDARSIEYFRLRGKRVHVSAVLYVLGQVQYTAKLMIQTFSGMRDDEVNTLPYHCLRQSKSRGIKHFLIFGRTTKYSKGLAKREKWVTNQEAHQAIRIAQEIADVIYQVHRTTPPKKNEHLAGHPLFVSVGYLGIKGANLIPDEGNFLPGRMGHRDLPKSCLAVIEDSDLCELEKIDPHRAWRAEEKFKIGAVWAFTSHQLRRSLALYAQRSGLVSLPSLRRQLKHITDEMSRYYAKGSIYARNFIGDNKTHFGSEWQMTQAESSALSYIDNVLTSEATLFGGHANWVRQRLKKPDGAVLLDRSETLRRFKKGELAYKETILGGCTNIGTCERVAVRWLHTACVIDNCKNLVGNVAKLDLVIAAQKNMIQHLDKDSVEYRTESHELETLIDIRTSANNN